MFLDSPYVTFMGKLDSIPLPGQVGKLSASQRNCDGIVGPKGNVVPGAEKKGFAPHDLDVGTGESGLTRQAVADVAAVFHR